MEHNVDNPIVIPPSWKYTVLPLITVEGRFKWPCATLETGDFLTKGFSSKHQYSLRSVTAVINLFTFYLSPCMQYGIEIKVIQLST